MATRLFLIAVSMWFAMCLAPTLSKAESLGEERAHLEEELAQIDNERTRLERESTRINEEREKLEQAQARIERELSGLDEEKAGREGDREQLEAAATEVSVAILRNDVKELLELSRLDASFQRDKEKNIRELMKKYFDKRIETSDIEMVKTAVLSEDEAMVKVKIHLSSADEFGRLSSASRAEGWTFVKGKRGDRRDKWLLLVDQIV